MISGYSLAGRMPILRIRTQPAASVVCQSALEQGHTTCLAHRGFPTLGGPYAILKSLVFWGLESKV